MRPLTEQQKTYYLEKWKVIRLNKWKYVAKHGVLFYALPVYTFITLYNLFLRHNDPLRTDEFLIGLVMWLLMGTLFGYWNFAINDKKYRQLTGDINAGLE